MTKAQTTLHMAEAATAWVDSLQRMLIERDPMVCERTAAGLPIHTAEVASPTEDAATTQAGYYAGQALRLGATLPGYGRCAPEVA